MKHLKSINEFLDNTKSYPLKLDRIEHSLFDRFITIYNHYYGKPKFTNYVYSFNDDNGNDYEIYLTYNEDVNALSISFLDTENLESEYKFKETNRFDQINILNTVINSVIMFMRKVKKDLDYIVIAGIDAKKIRIYNILLKKYLGEWIKSDVDRIDIEDDPYIIIVKNPNTNTNTNMYVDDKKLIIEK